MPGLQLSESWAVPHISVCVLTYRRPELLHKCLEALQRQKAVGFSYSIVVVDNDRSRSARAVVEYWQERSTSDMQYDVEPVQNISLARNRAVSASRGELIAFIDDDECPELTWLWELYRVHRHFGADGVLGPVLPHYEGTPPVWLLRSGLCVRSASATGTVLTSVKCMRTGNVLLRRNLFDGSEAPFDPSLGRIGGEDIAFFTRMLREGRSFVWCNEARVFESVPQQRQRRSYHLRRALVRGGAAARREPVLSLGTVKSLLAVIVYSASLPLLFVLGQHRFMKCLVKDCDHLGKLLAYAGIRLVRSID